MNDAPLSMRQRRPWIAAGLAFLVLLYLLAPILTPFVIGAGLAYLGDPLVDRLQRLRLSRTAGVAVVFVVLTLLLMLAIFALVPLLQQQFLTLLRNLPDWLTWLQTSGLPKLGIKLPADLQLNPEGLRQLVSEHWSGASDVLTRIWQQASKSTGALLTLLANLFLVPIVTFYLLRDWDLLVAWIRGMIPPRWLPMSTQLAGEANDVLGAFIRGQLLVMAALSVYYVVTLWIAGLDLALVVGLIIGLVSFVPYLGTIIGVLIATIAMLVQTQELWPLLWLALIFGIGQFLESNVLTPLLVGDKIGLHPVAVIFAVMAGGQLFGFIGVLLALPAAAVLAVLMRHFKDQWLSSPFYHHSEDPSLPSAAPAPEAEPPPIQ